MKSKTIATCAVFVSFMLLLPTASLFFSFVNLAEPDADIDGSPVTSGEMRNTGEGAAQVPPVSVIGDLESGYVGTYFNLPSDHPEVEGDITGVVTGDSPFNHDWYDEQYFSFRRSDQNLTFGNGFFPVDDGLPGDPHYFAAHWQANITVPDCDNYTFLMGSDDDSWLYIDESMVIDLGGVHALSRDNGTAYLEPGAHSLDIYFAERHLTESGFYFEFLDPRVEVAHTVIWDDIRAEAGDPVFLKGSCSYDPDGVIQAYNWDFGDGLAGTEADTTHTYARPGTYTVTLTVTDADGLTDTDTCLAEITGESVDLFVGQQDILVESSPALGQTSTVSTTIHCNDPYAEGESIGQAGGMSLSNSESGVSCTLEVYLDSVSEADILFRQCNVWVNSDYHATVSFGWSPLAEGQHELVAVVKDSCPAETDLGNNTASLPVRVGGEIVPVMPSLEYWIEYIYPADQTIVDTRGIMFFTSGAYPDRMRCVPFNETFSIPESDYGVYPMYNSSVPCTYRLHIRNLDDVSHAGLNVMAVQEYHNTVTIWDSLGVISLTQGQQIPGTPPKQWMLDLTPGQEVVVIGYHVATARGWGLDQTHLTITWNGTTLVDDPVAGVYCPPP